jgi:hypothetical protein
MMNKGQSVPLIERQPGAVVSDIQTLSPDETHLALVEQFLQTSETAVKTAAASWFIYHWMQEFLISAGRCGEFDFSKMFKAEHFVKLQEHYPLFRISTIPDVAATITLGGNVVFTCLDLLQMALKFCLPQTRTTSATCDCISCCHHTQNCLGRLLPCRKTYNQIVGNPAYIWAHVDMALSLIGSSYENSPVTHVTAASITAAVIVFQLLIHVWKSYQDKGVVERSLCVRLTRLITAVGKLGVSRSSWIWAFYLLVTTIFIPMYWAGFSIAAGYSSIAPAVMLTRTAFSCVYNCFRSEDKDIQELRQSLQDFMRRYSIDVFCMKVGCPCSKPAE